MSDGLDIQEIPPLNDIMACTVCARGEPLPRSMDIEDPNIVTNHGPPSSLAIPTKTQKGELFDYKWKDGSNLVVKFLHPLQSKHNEYKDYHTRIENMVRETAIIWQTCTNITFKFVAYNAAEMPHLMLTFMTNKEVIDAGLSPNHYGHWSYLGQSCQGLNPSMNLNFVPILQELDRPEIKSDRRDYLSKYMHATILHEFGHALGFIHEHLRGDRGEKMELDIDAIIKYNKDKWGWSEEKTRANINDVWKMDYLNASTLDLKSIMIYPFEKFKLKQVPGKADEITQPTDLSDTDKAWARLIYPPIKAA
ncbi:hypothetical protein H2198_008317 [Neophaeococcomyces mojaviensis]|uniref:Uncharacterized protein n=1 Tax=Neophaeococcomyces mojaviensis TaxID=3383035 RepID=A0ACC2ZXY1_9EURO|nr:hypothetical protein H2198_008317 [Knufia sp. JES_112]